MDLRNYWRVLARPDTKESDWDFYSNGWFSKTDDCTTTVYRENGYEFVSGQISRIVALSNGFTAIREKIGNKEEWTVYSEQCVPVMTLNHSVEVLCYGLLTFKTPDGETRAVAVDNPKDKVSLGYQVTDVLDAPDGVFAYAQKIRGHTYWHLCRLVSGKLVKNEILPNVHELFFFDNGSYAAYGKDFIVRIYKSSGQKIFACDTRKTTFYKVGGNHFIAYNGMRYQGIYSAEDGKLVYCSDAIKYYFDNKANYVPGIGLSFDCGRGFIAKTHDVVPFGNSLVAFMLKNRRYVIDTAMPIEKLRELVLGELLSLSEGENLYGAYLANLLTRLYHA